MNPQQLPLYDNIYDHVNKSNLINMDLNIEQKNNFIKLVKKLTKNDSVIFYILIRFFQLKHDEGIDSFNLPYKSKKQKNGYKFDLDNFPNTLKQILNRFLEINFNNKE